MIRLHQNGSSGSTSRPSVTRFWKVWLVGADCVLIGMQPIWTHMTKQNRKTYSFHPVSATFMVDVTKTSLALLVLLVYDRGKTSKANKPRVWSGRLFLMNAYANKGLLVPASLYAFNGYLKFMMLLYFTPTTAKMLGNLKVLVIAVMMKIVLDRRFSVIQWEALVLLCVGISIHQMTRCMDQGYQFPPAAILCTSASLLVPSMASIFNEWAMKRHMETSVHLQSFFLCFFALCINLIALTCVSLFTGRSLSVLFSGHSRYSGLLVVNNALQGILASFFYKYADTILKKYSSTLATVFTAVMSAVLFDEHLNTNFLISVITVFISMHIFFSQGGLKQGAGKALNESHQGSTRENVWDKDFGDRHSAMEAGLSEHMTHYRLTQAQAL